MNSFQGPLREKNHLSPKCQRRISKEDGASKGTTTPSTASTTFSLCPFVFSFFLFSFFFVPACQSNGVETDRLILELSLEAELQQGSNIQGKKTHMGKNENKKGRENET